MFVQRASSRVCDTAARPESTCSFVGPVADRARHGGICADLCRKRADPKAAPWTWRGVESYIDMPQLSPCRKVLESTRPACFTLHAMDDFGLTTYHLEFDLLPSLFRHLSINRILLEANASRPRKDPEANPDELMEATQQLARSEATAILAARDERGTVGVFCYFTRVFHFFISIYLFSLSLYLLFLVASRVLVNGLLLYDVVIFHVSL